jgi:sugar/nucleoside kinase (ribokinase family)
VKTGVTVNLVQGLKRSQVTYPGAMGRFSTPHIPAMLFHELAHLHVSGIYQLRSLLPHVAGIMERAAEVGATISLDCQWDPTERWGYLDAWLPFVDWLVVNEQEAVSMTGSPGAAGALLSLASRTRCPVVKAGAAGSWVVEDGKAVPVPAYRVDVVDTIGAGDNFDAAFLFAMLEKGMALREAARFANAAAARSCTFRGGTDARSSFPDIIRFMETTS